MRPGFLKAGYLGAAMLIAAGAVLAAISTEARAGFVLEMSSGASSVTVNDGGGLDIDPNAGRIMYAGSIGSFFINLTTGQSKPALGTAVQPEMRLSSVDVSSGGGGTLTIKLTDTDFATPNALTSWTTSLFGGTTGAASLSFQAYVNTDNQEFSTGQLVADFNSLNGIFNEFTQSLATVGAGQPFSATLIATVVHGSGFQATGFTANVKDPPLSVSEPTALALMGIGLLGMGGLLLRRRRHDEDSEV